MSDERNEEETDDLWWLRDLTPKKEVPSSTPQTAHVVRRVRRDFSRQDDDEMGKTQPTKKVIIDSSNNKTVSTPENPKFGWGSFFSLLGLIWIAEGFGSAFPGPIDDILWDLIAALFFGLIQYLRLKLPLLDRFLRSQWSRIWQELGKKYPKLANGILFYLGNEKVFDEEK